MPRPVLQAMVLADHVYQDRLSGKFIISGTFGRIALRAAPVAQPPIAQPPAAPPSYMQPPAVQPSFAPPPQQPQRPLAPTPSPAPALPPAQPEAPFAPVAPMVPSPVAAPIQPASAPFEPTPSDVVLPPANPPAQAHPLAPPAPASPPPQAAPSSPSPAASRPPAPTPTPSTPAPAVPRQAPPKNENYVSHSLDTAAAQISVSGSPYLYLALTSIHHKAALNIQFVNQSDGDTIFDALLEVTSSDPVSVSEFCVPMPQLPITKAGVYSIDLLYSGEILGSWRLVATTI